MSYFEDSYGISIGIRTYCSRCKSVRRIDNGSCSKCNTQIIIVEQNEKNTNRTNDMLKEQTSVLKSIYEQNEKNVSLISIQNENIKLLENKIKELEEKISNIQQNQQRSK